MEALVGMAIGLPLLLILYQMGVTSAQAITTVQGLGQAELILNSATDSFMRDVRRAQAVDPTCRKDPTIIEDLTSVGDGRATLLLRTPAIIGGQQSMTRFDYVIYDFTASGPTANQLRRIVKRDRLSSQPESERVVAQNVTSVTFTTPTSNPSTPFGEVNLNITVAVSKDRFTFSQIANCRAAWRN